MHSVGLPLCVIWPLLAAGSASAGSTLPSPAPATCAPMPIASTQAKPSIRPPHIQPISARAWAKFFLSAKEALDVAHHAIVVDVRPSSEAATFWIPGAIRIAPEFLSANALVQSADKVLLIGSGRDDLRLLGILQAAQGQKLQDHARIVSGGFPAWHRAGGSIMGDITSLDSPAVLDPKEFHDLIARAVPILLVGKLSLDEKKAMPKARELREGVSVGATINSLRTDAGPGQEPIVLVLRSSNKIAEWSSAWTSAFHQTPYLFVDSGDRYIGYLDQQNRIAANAGKPLLRRCDAR